MNSQQANPPFRCPFRAIVVIVPVFDDWESLVRLYDDLSEAMDLVGWQHEWELLAINDSPHLPPLTPSGERVFENRPNLSEIRLARNVGHQRAIAIGLALAARSDSVEYCVVMDGDGEDAAADAVKLLTRCRDGEGRVTVFAERTKRSEGLRFRCGYAVYRLLHYLVAGIPIRFGNFSAIPIAHVRMVTKAPEVWSHYAAAVLRCGIPFEKIPTTRALRFAGQSHMSMTSLIAHGLTALSVFQSIAVVRLYGAALACWALLLPATAACLWTEGDLSKVMCILVVLLGAAGAACASLVPVLSSLNARTLAGADLDGESQRLIATQTSSLPPIRVDS